MKEGQEKIYYLLAPVGASSPHLEVFRAKGIEVLLLGHPVDNWLVATLHEFEGKPLQSVAQGSSDLGGLADEAERQASEQASQRLAPLLARLKEALGGKVSDVRVTSRLTTSPACIVAGEPDTEVSLAHRLRGSGLPQQTVLEINPAHPLVSRFAAETDGQRFVDWAHVLYSQAVLTYGAGIEDPAEFARRLDGLLVSLLSSQDDDVAADEGGGVGGEEGDDLGDSGRAGDVEQ
jgi:molecular chaperone HtpG